MSNKEKILQAGEKLFTQNGYNNTSMRMLCEEAGVSMGGIYTHFKTKDEIFCALLTQLHPFQKLGNIVMKHKHKEPEQFFYDMGNELIKLFNKKILRLMFIDIIERNGCTFKNCIIDLTNQDKSKMDLVLYIEEKQKQGKITQSDSIKLAKTFFQMAVSHSIGHHLIINEPNSKKEKIATEFKDVIKTYLFGALSR